MSSRETCPTCRGQALVRWTGWHFLELVALGVPVALAATVSPWWLLITVAVGTAWAVHELRVVRRRRTNQPEERPLRLPAGTGESAVTEPNSQPGKGASA